MKHKNTVSKIIMVMTGVMFVVNVQAGTNRGRIQAQGSSPKVEKSKSWDQSTPPTQGQSLAWLDSVWNSLSATEKKDRLKAYDCAKNFINSAASSGGVSAVVSKTCQDPQRKDSSARIDVEVLSGTAFKP